MSEIDGLGKVVDTITRLSGHSTSDSALTDLLHGPSTRNTGLPAAAIQDNQGLTFCSRPMCNLHPDNVGASSILEYLGDSDPYSIGSAIRQYMSTQKLNDKYNIPPSELVDKEGAFIDIMGNTLENLTGFPDHLATIFTSDEGAAKETYSWVDSRPEINGNFSLSATFHNVEGDIVTKLATALHYYAGNMAYGSMTRFPLFIATNIIDYQISFYRIILDRTRTKVVKIAKTGPAIIESPGDGSGFNLVSESVLNQENAKITLPVKFDTIRYNDPKIVDDFNRLVKFHNPSMNPASLKAHRDDPSSGGDMLLLNREEITMMSNYAFPYLHTIDTVGSTQVSIIRKGEVVMEWWARVTDYNNILNNGSFVTGA